VLIGPFDLALAAFSQGKVLHVAGQAFCCFHENSPEDFSLAESV
jgi:hypothetical protein